jgi:hypothetical protein
VAEVSSQDPCRMAKTGDARKVSAKTPTPGSSFKNRAELANTLAVLVLVLGIASASIVFWSGQSQSASRPDTRESSLAEGGWKDSTLPIEDLKGGSRTIEMNYGKAAVLIVGWLHWWGQLKPHESLAIMIASVSTLIALTCFLFAKRWRLER